MNNFQANEFYFVIFTFNANFGLTNLGTMPYNSANYGPVAFTGSSGTFNITETVTISNFQLNLNSDVVLCLLHEGYSLYGWY